ncbi:MAG TPA: dipicolinate synthase subunit DpsA [Bacilli bacterium]
MLTGTQIAIVGGDARQIEVINKFSDMDANVLLMGFDDLQINMGGVRKVEMSPAHFASLDAVVLPAVGSDDTGIVSTIFSSETLKITESHIASLPGHAKIYTGLAKPYLRQICEKENVDLVELFEQDDVAIYNSIPTAEGAIMMAIQNTDITIHGAVSMVLGLGRTGMTLSRLLQGMGAKVKVGVRRKEHFARAMEMGFKPFFLQDLGKEAAEIDLLFNTIPTMIVTSQVIANIPHQALIIDLASKPGGTDFRYAEKRGIKALLAPSLPGIVAPKTAGRIIANVLFDMILEDSRKRRDEQ